MLAVSDASPSASNRFRGWCGFGLIRAMATSIGAALAGAALRDERGETATQALASFGSDCHDVTAIFDSSSGPVDPDAPVAVA